MTAKGSSSSVTMGTGFLLVALRKVEVPVPFSARSNFGKPAVTLR
jgi:hypothetical protein